MGIWTASLKAKLPDLIKRGRLRVVLPDGDAFETGPDETPHLTVRVHEPRWMRRILTDPAMQLGEAWMAGGLTVEDGDIYDLLDLIWLNLSQRPTSTSWTLGGRILNGMRLALRRARQLNDARKARRNISRHYDIGNDLYRLFLDTDMQYSCAYFPEPDISLDEAQRLKREHIARKLCLQPGQSVLDIGCGWGGLALHMAQQAGVSVEGITLSEQQIAIARQRAATTGLSGTVDFRLVDYRKLAEPYDRVVSVGMLEHVGLPQFETYFEQVAKLLKQDGVALIHTIGRPHGPGITNPWIARHIFPGGYIPALSELMPAIEKAGLTVLDVEILRLHYAETLKAWRARFLAHADRAREMYDETFVRMWDFYLAASEVSFRYGEHVVFQIQLGHSQTAAPLTRDYLYAGGEVAAARPRLSRIG